jgi:MurNAc alpha-1-phosphate uridylyltransferase
VQCVVLAGGLGSRMQPWTDRMPKALIPVAGRPFADLQLEWLAAEGVTDVVYSIGYLGGMLRLFVGDGTRWGLRVDYVDEGDDLRGTAGALRLALDQGVLDREFLLLYGDSYLSVDLRRVWRAFGLCGHPALMTVFRNDGRFERSNVVYRRGLVERYDKATPAPGMAFIDYGLSVLSREVVGRSVAPGRACDLATVFHNLSVAGRLAGYQVHERFYEIGSEAGLLALEARLGAVEAEPTAGTVIPPSPAQPLADGGLRSR